MYYLCINSQTGLSSADKWQCQCQSGSVFGSEDRQTFTYVIYICVNYQTCFSVSFHNSRCICCVNPVNTQISRTCVRPAYSFHFDHMIACVNWLVSYDYFKLCKVGEVSFNISISPQVIYFSIYLELLSIVVTIKWPKPAQYRAGPLLGKGRRHFEAFVFSRLSLSNSTVFI